MREYAAQKEIDEQAALGVGMKEKAEEFVASDGVDISVKQLGTIVTSVPDMLGLGYCPKSAARAKLSRGAHHSVR